ncbi:GPN-loop GTPase QQT1 [Tetranychus urticae]|uniref:GPN-loop GTPase 2 n=1 Tax=Tetranychus urticae TaxID=32264 RepID=T1K3M2_TETUR|nr:GPN-loop GTPase QQT1 [Tetranychus urticae]
MEKEQVIFGQIVVGPPGSGKTTYCSTIHKFLNKLGRKTFIVNLDPGNDVSLPYKPDIDVKNLISLDDTMQEHSLGPNGGLIYCMEYLETNLDWLIDQIKKVCFSPENQRKKSYPYLIFDSPGQVELYVHNKSLKNILKNLTSRSVAGFDLRLTSVNLVDSYYANDPGKFISALLNSLATMLHLELPHVNILSKVDLIEKFGPIRFNIDYYCEVLDLNYLIDQIIDDPFMEKFKKLSQAIAGVVESYGLVTFVPLDVNDPKTMFKAMRLIDKANGHFLIDIETEEKVQEIYEETQNADFDYAKYMEIRERLIKSEDIPVLPS